MKLDETLTGIITQIQVEIREKYNIEIGIDTIHKVVATQLEATILGISKNTTIHWTKFCKFVFTDRKTLKDQRSMALGVVNRNEKLLPHEKIQQRKNIIIDSAVKQREMKNKAKNRLLVNDSTIETLSNTPSTNNPSMPMFKILNKKHTKENE